MSYPANLAPQTPSAKYDIEACGDGLGTKPLYALMKSGLYLTITGAKSMCRIDLPEYDKSVTRDTFDASSVGTGPSVIEKIQDSGTPLSFQIAQITGPIGVLVEGPTTVTGTPLYDAAGTLIQQDDNFTHTAAHQNVIGNTMIRWYDTAGAAGNKVAECAALVYRCMSDKIPQYSGSVPPTYIPT